MQKSGSENLFIPFIKKNKSVILTLVLLLFGVLLMLAPSGESEPSREEESRASEICGTVQGVGRCSVMLNIREGDIISAVVLCDGADSPSVESEIKELISSLYGIGYNRISVLKLSE